VIACSHCQELSDDRCQTVCLIALVFGWLAMPPSKALAQATAQASVTEEEAHAIGVDAYLYYMLW
jgi:hypothetical protein